MLKHKSRTFRDDTSRSLLALMTEKRVCYPPVVKDGSRGGIISIGDLAKSIIADQRFTIDQLETYCGVYMH